MLCVATAQWAVAILIKTDRHLSCREMPMLKSLHDNLVMSSPLEQEQDLRMLDFYRTSQRALCDLN